MKPKLLIVELWGLGDLIIATPFICAASKTYDLTLLAKPYALEMQPRFWPGVKVVTFTAPWTPFKNKYLLWRWPFRQIWRLRQQLAGQHFEFGLSARWDPRDHLLLKMVGAKNRLGFPRIGSQRFLTQPLARPEPQSHRYEYWRAIGEALKIKLPPRHQIIMPGRAAPPRILIHSGARLDARIWPLERYRQIVHRLREKGHTVQIACDPDQSIWWQNNGETEVVAPQTVAELLTLIDRAGIFIGNCSGPGHLAAINGVPTFTIFGPSLPEWFAPLHSAAEWIEGKACPYKPCSDYCRYPTPHCLWNVTELEVWERVEKFTDRHLGQPSGKNSGGQVAALTSA